MESLLFELLQKIIGVDTILFVGIIWTLVLDINIYIYDIDSNLRCPTTKKCLWYMNVPIYGNILTYSSIYTSKGYPETLVASC